VAQCVKGERCACEDGRVWKESVCWVCTPCVSSCRQACGEAAVSRLPSFCSQCVCSRWVHARQANQGSPCVQPAHLGQPESSVVVGAVPGLVWQTGWWVVGGAVGTRGTAMAYTPATSMPSPANQRSAVKDSVKEVPEVHQSVKLVKRSSAQSSRQASLCVGQVGRRLGWCARRRLSISLQRCPSACPHARGRDVCGTARANA